MWQWSSVGVKDRSSNDYLTRRYDWDLPIYWWGVKKEVLCSLRAILRVASQKWARLRIWSFFWGDQEEGEIALSQTCLNWCGKPQKKQVFGSLYNSHVFYLLAFAGWRPPRSDSWIRMEGLLNSSPIRKIGLLIRYCRSCNGFYEDL